MLSQHAEVTYANDEFNNFKFERCTFSGLNLLKNSETEGYRQRFKSVQASTHSSELRDMGLALDLTNISTSTNINKEGL